MKKWNSQTELVWQYQKNDELLLNSYFEYQPIELGIHGFFMQSIGSRWIFRINLVYTWLIYVHMIWNWFEWMRLMVDSPLPQFTKQSSKNRAMKEPILIGDWSIHEYFSNRFYFRDHELLSKLTWFAVIHKNAYENILKLS